jgi:hypothetical protein
VISRFNTRVLRQLIRLIFRSLRIVWANAMSTLTALLVEIKKLNAYENASLSILIRLF